MTQIAVNCEKIIENPTKGVTRHPNEVCLLKQVLVYLQDDDVRVRLLAMLSLLKVFNDILPVPISTGITCRTILSTLLPRKKRKCS